MTIWKDTGAALMEAIRADLNVWPWSCFRCRRIDRRIG